MLLIDSSAWIEYLRRCDSAVSDLVADALREETAATTDIVLLEVLSGTNDGARLTRWERLLSRCHYVEQLARHDAESAASLFRACRRAGETPRATNDCLVAAVAIRRDTPVLHRDRGFDVLARHTGLRAVTG